MPFDNFIKIGISRCKISVSRMFCTFNNGLRNRRHCRKVHIRHPHRDKIKTSLWFWRWHSRIHSKTIYSHSILSLSVNDRCKIIFHIIPILIFSSIDCSCWLPFTANFIFFSIFLYLHRKSNSFSVFRWLFYSISLYFITELLKHHLFAKSSVLSKIFTKGVYLC